MNKESTLISAQWGTLEYFLMLDMDSLLQEGLVAYLDVEVVAWGLNLVRKRQRLMKESPSGCH